MDWDLLIHAVDDEPAALNRLAEAKWSHDAAVAAALLLLEDAPHPAATLVVAGIAAQRAYGRPVAAALTPHVVSALAAWSADPDWTERSIGGRNPGDLILGIAHLIAALHAAPPALCDAVGIVARNGGWMSIDAGLAALGSDGWGLLADEERRALWTRVWQDGPAALGGIWSALSDAQRTRATQQDDRTPGRAAAFIGSIDAAAWEATDGALRQRLIDAAARAPSTIHLSAPAWTGMSDMERERLVTAVVDAVGNPSCATPLLEALGRDGRRALSSAQRVALDALAAQDDEWGTALLRVVNAGWNAPSVAERRMLMERAATAPPCAAPFIRAVGVDVRRALPTNVQAALRAAVQRSIGSLFRCPPSLWHNVNGGRLLPPSLSVASRGIETRRAADADADLSALSRERQAMVLAPAPWRPADLAPQSPRIARLLVAWNAMTPGARVALATALPQALALIAAARLAACEPSIAATSHLATDSVADALRGMVLRSDPDAAVRATVGRTLAETGRRRSWMCAFAPMDDDAPADRRYHGL